MPQTLELHVYRALPSTMGKISLTRIREIAGTDAQGENAYGLICAT